MIDGCGREIDHLRLSVTDHCNLACRYCVPSKRRAEAGKMIDAEFAFQAVEWLVRDHGIRYVRLTGGEPLLHPQIVPLVRRLALLPQLTELTLTTNGQALARHAIALRDAGLTRVNVSLDTLNSDSFRLITRGGELIRTLDGVQAAIDAGLTPLKVNVVVQRDVNDDELVALAEWGLAQGCVVRFLEVMPIGPAEHMIRQHLVSADEILQQLSQAFELRAIPAAPGQPALDYALIGTGVRGVIGVIAPTTRPFCSSCRRIRLTATGDLVPCLHDRNRLNLRTAWKDGCLDEALAADILRAVVGAKAPTGPMNQNVPLITIGG